MAASDMGVEYVLGLPALDEGESGGVLDALVQ
jgi:hypothetical protein